MKKMIKTTAMALGVVTAMGATWAVSGAYHASDASKSNAVPAVFVQEVGYSTDALMTSLNEKADYEFLQTVKSVLRPVKNFFVGSDVLTYNGVPVHKACGGGTISVNGSIFNF